jgi:hypothetical protein
LDFVTESLTLIAGKAEPSFGVHLVEALHARGRFLGHALDRRLDPRIELRILGEARLDGGVERGLFLARRVAEAARIRLGDGAEMHEQGRIAAVVQDHVWAAGDARPRAPAPGHSKIRCV